MTNREWLESLSDEMLAKILDDIGEWGECCTLYGLLPKNFRCIPSGKYSGCANCIIHFLQAEHKEG